MSQRLCPLCSGRESLLINRTGDFRIVRCRECGFTYLENPSQETELYETFWGEDDELPEVFAGDAQDASLREAYHINRQRVEYLKSLRPNGSLLDIGCGNGFFLTLAQQVGYECIGQEVSQNAIRFARNNFNLSIIDEALENIVQDQKMMFDIITIWHVLEHVNDPILFLKQIYTILKPGGILVVEVPNLNSLKFRLSNWKWEGGNHPKYHQSYFIHQTLTEMLQAAGFSHSKKMRLSYRLPGKNRAYTIVKQSLNLLGLDSFISVAAHK